MWWIFLGTKLTPLHSLPKHKTHQVLVDWLPPPSIEVPVHRPLALQPDVLVGWVIWEKHTPLEVLGCRGCSVPLASEDLISDCQVIKRCADLLGQLLYIFHSWYGSQLLPPVGCIQLAGWPLQPQLLVFDGWLWWETLPVPGAPANHGHLHKMLQLQPSGGKRA